MKPRRASRNLVEMSWDPITRIVGSLGIYTKIDFANRQVAECHSTSSIFRGYSIFMKGKDPRDAHFITSRICGICGDNHATCAMYAQNMAFGIQPPAMAEWIVNLGEAAEYMFDHNIFQDNLVGVDFCEQMVKETNPGVWDKAQRTPAPHANLAERHSGEEVRGFRQAHERRQGIRRAVQAVSQGRSPLHRDSAAPFDRPLLCPIAIARGLGMGGYTLNFDEQWVLIFHRVGDKVHLIRRNVHFKAKSGSPVAKAVETTYTDSVLMALHIRSHQPATQQRAAST